VGRVVRCWQALAAACGAAVGLAWRAAARCLRRASAAHHSNPEDSQMTTTTYTDRAAHAAHVQGLDAHAEALRIIGTPEYRHGCPAAHAKVQAHFAEAYGSGDPVRTAIGPGQVPRSPFARG
jgi:hypothetical protein